MTITATIERTETRSGLAQAGMAVIAVGILYLQRFGFPVGDSFIPICLAPILIGIGMIGAAGILTVSRHRIELWLFATACIVLSVFSQSAPFSTMSLFYLLAVYTPLILVAPDVNEDDYKYYLAPYQWAVIPLAILGVIQFASLSYADPIRDHFGRFVMTGYNTHPYLNDTSRFMRSNAYFLGEPSSLSQTCATALLMELTFFKNRLRSAIYAAGLFSAASGSGLVMLGIFLIAHAWRNNKMPYLVAGGLVAAIVIAVTNNVVIDTLLGRVSEFSDPGSSAYGRFFAPFIQASLQLRDFSDWIVGLGPGAYNGDRLLTQGWSLTQIGGVIAPVKMLVEYGIVGALSFTVFVTTLFFYRARSGVVSVGLFLAYMLMSSSLQSPANIYLYYIIIMLFPKLTEQL